MEQANSVERFLSLLNRYDGYSEKYYRGQLEKYTSIPPSIARDEGYLTNESSIYHESIEMKKEEFSLLDSPIEKLSKLQHYGIPTRLVDVTIDPLYALYFAVENIDDLSPGNVLIYLAEGHDIGSDHAKLLALIATLPTFAIDEIIVEFRRLYGVSLSVEQVLAYSDAPVFIKHSENLKRYNERLHSQRGAFLICGNKVAAGRITSNLKSLDSITPVAVIRIPYEYKKQIKDELDRSFGINNVSVYPELPSVAGYIKEKYKKENISFDGKYSIVATKNISHGLAKRLSVTVVLNDIFRIDQVKAIATEVINGYKNTQDVVWVYIAKTGDDFIVSNWILRGQWINPCLDKHYRPLTLKETGKEGYYWEAGSSYSTMADYYEKYVFDDDKSLFVYHQKIFEEFLPIYDALFERFSKGNIKEFSRGLDIFQNQLSRLFMALQDFGHSRNKEFDDYLYNYSNAISPIDDIHYLMENDKISAKALKYHIKGSFDTSKKHIDIIKKSAPKWKKHIGVSELEYERIDPNDRKKPDFQYTPTLPISETAIDVYFNIEVLVADDRTFHIQGDTNLFDNAVLMLSLKNANQGKATITDGKFSFPQFSKKGKGFEPGLYHATISLSIPSTQPKEFTALAGIEYENLTGEYVKRDGIGPSVSYEFDFSI